MTPRTNEPFDEINIFQDEGMYRAQTQVPSDWLTLLGPSEEIVPRAADGLPVVQSTGTSPSEAMERLYSLLGKLLFAVGAKRRESGKRALDELVAVIDPSERIDGQMAYFMWRRDPRRELGGEWVRAVWPRHPKD